LPVRLSTSVSRDPGKNQNTFVRFCANESFRDQAIGSRRCYNRRRSLFLESHPHFAGDPSAAEQLLPLVYEELRKLAAAKLVHEKPGQTLQATALVHEAYLKLVDVDKAQHWNSRGHFFCAAAEAMRRILLNRARDKNRHKRGSLLRKIELDNVEVALETPDEELLALDEALDRLGTENEICADLVKLRFFAGLSTREAATALGISTSTADRYWAYARAWLFSALRPEGGDIGQ
jgi:RNA polymerase sigma factor (TIGR02999 family)